MGLTDAAVRNKKPPKGRTEISDGNGLYLQLLPSGAKTWVFRYRYDEKSKRMTIGHYPALTLADARNEADKHRLLLKQGKDPAAEKAKKELERKTAPTVNDFLLEYAEHHLAEKRSGQATLRLLKKDVVPAWGKRKIRSITRREIVLLLDEIKKRAPIVRNRVHGALSNLFNVAAERGVIDQSPCTGIKKPKEKSRDHTLTDDEIKTLWSALDLENMVMDCYRLTKLALKMLLITGQRPGEVAGMAWDEIDGEVWTIPADRSKIGEAHEVPLTPLAMEIIEQARLFASDSRFVFRSTHRSGDQPMTRHALSRAVKNHWAGIGIAERFTPHDLRRTVRTRLAALGVEDIVAEKVVGHKLQGMLAVYNRHNYADEKRLALARWEKHLRHLVGEVVEPAKIYKLKVA